MLVLRVSVKNKQNIVPRDSHISVKSVCKAHSIVLYNSQVGVKSVSKPQNNVLHVSGWC